MLWIKRNILLAIGALLAVLLLGGGLFYLLTARGKSSQLEEELAATKGQLEELYKKNPFPSKTNIDSAKHEGARLQSALATAKRFFTPVPTDKVTGLAFRTFRDNTLAELQRLAEQQNVSLPARNYGFSFDVLKTKVEFGEGTFPAIPEQMSEVRAITKILFDAHVNPLVSIRRARVSDDDRQSQSASDYIGLTVTTNETTGAISSPYEVTFYCLSSELAAALEGFNKAPHGFIVKAIHVEPAPEAAAGPGAPLQSGAVGAGSFQPPQGSPPPRRFPGTTPSPPANPPPASRGPGAAPSRPGAGDRPVVVLKERRLKVTLLIYAVRNAK